jgi:hypothetical protein
MFDEEEKHRSKIFYDFPFLVHLGKITLRRRQLVLVSGEQKYHATEGNFT